MYNLEEEPVNNMLTAAKKLEAALTRSPWWPVIKDEPPIMNFVEAILKFEKEISRCHTKK